MDPDDETRLTILVATHRKTQEMEKESRDALYAFIQDKLNAAKRGTVGVLVEEFAAATELSRARIFDIRAGNWTREDARKAGRKA